MPDAEHVEKVAERTFQSLGSFLRYIASGFVAVFSVNRRRAHYRQSLKTLERHAKPLSGDGFDPADDRNEEPQLVGEVVQPERHCVGRSASTSRRTVQAPESPEGHLTHKRLVLIRQPTFAWSRDFVL